MAKMRKAAANRAYRRRFGNNPFWSYPPGSPERLAAVAAEKLCVTAWERCKGIAIERAAGIG